MHVFGDDAAAALEVKSQNPIWLSLVHRAGGPTLRISRRMLYVAVEIAARDKRINDGIWRSLEPGRKELLLPIGDEAEMRKAAKHVVEMKMSQDSTREYVAQLRADAGDAPKSRMTIGRVTIQVSKFHKTLRATAALRELRKAAAGATEGQKVALRKELDGVAKWLTEARRVLK